MIKLKKIGFFKEFSYGDSDGQSINEFIHKGDLSVIDKVSNYLKNGTVMMVAPTITTDIFLKEKKIGTLCIQTDGTWVWPSDLAYYVENYNISLPIEFIEDVFKSNGIISTNINISLLTF